MKAVALAGLIPATWLAFGVVSWALSTFLFGWIAQPVMVVLPLTLLVGGVIWNIIIERNLEEGSVTGVLPSSGERGTPSDGSPKLPQAWP